MRKTIPLVWMLAWGCGSEEAATEGSDEGARSEFAIVVQVDDAAARVHRVRFTAETVDCATASGLGEATTTEVDATDHGGQVEHLLDVHPGCYHLTARALDAAGEVLPCEATDIGFDARTASAAHLTLSCPGPAEIPEVGVRVQALQNAQQIADAAVVNGAIDPPGDVDNFAFVATRTGTYTIETTGNTDTYGTLYSGADVLLAQHDDIGGGNFNFQIRRHLTAGNAYFISVRHFSANGTGAYSLRVLRPAAAPVQAVLPQGTARCMGHVRNRPEVACSDRIVTPQGGCPAGWEFFTIDDRGAPAGVHYFGCRLRANTAVATLPARLVVNHGHSMNGPNLNACGASQRLVLLGDMGAPANNGVEICELTQNVAVNAGNQALPFAGMPCGLSHTRDPGNFCAGRQIVPNGNGNCPAGYLLRRFGDRGDAAGQGAYACVRG
jgi:hypothetical protein